MFPPEKLAQMLDAACEGHWDLERMNDVGERIWNLERQFNLAAGFTRADDCLPVRTTTEPAVGGAADGEVADITQMLAEYYLLRGWDHNGVPLAATLARLEI
jgi:aldehyde:ferredoxin oxidoreductase